MILLLGFFKHRLDFFLKIYRRAELYQLKLNSLSLFTIHRPPVLKLSTKSSCSAVTFSLKGVGWNGAILPSSLLLILRMTNELDLRASSSVFFSSSILCRHPNNSPIIARNIIKAKIPRRELHSSSFSFAVCKVSRISVSLRMNFPNFSNFKWTVSWEFLYGKRSFQKMIFKILTFHHVLNTFSEFLWIF